MMGARGKGRRGASSRDGSRDRVREDVDREIRSHLALREEDLIGAGWSPEDAREEAIRVFGDRQAVARACRAITVSHERATRRSRMVEGFWQDLRYGARTLRRSPGFALVAGLTLALGIGANTAIFSVVDGVLLKPLAYESPEELVWITENNNHGGTMSVVWPNFQDWWRETKSFSGLTAFGTRSTTVLGGDEPFRSRVGVVTRDFWKVFPVRPVRGRTTVAADHVEGAEPAAVVRRSVWEARLGGRALDSYSVEILGRRYQIVGVVPDDFDFPSEVDFWVPVELDRQGDSRTAHNWRVVGRLGPDVSIQQAGEEVDALTKRIVASVAGEDPDFLATGATIVPLRIQVIGDSSRPLLLLLGAAGLVLLVACSNLASMLLARGAVRRRELAVRTSLGAGRVRIARQLLTESVLLALVGGTLGVALAAFTLRALKALGPASVPRLTEVGIDPGVLAYTLGICVVTAALFGLLPALKLTHSPAGEALRGGGRGNALDPRGWVWRILVGTEVAFAMVLLAGSGLLLRSFGEILNEDAGFDERDVQLLDVSLSRLKYPTEADHSRWFAGFLEELEALPGVASAGVISALPGGGGAPTGRLDLDGDPNRHTVAGYVVASPGAFEALDIPLLQGRLFDDREGPDARHVVVVSRSFAETVWPGQDPIGRSVSGGGMDNFYADGIFAEVVGVVGDVRFRDLSREPIPTVYFSYLQRPFRILFGASVVVEAENGDPAGLASGVRATLRRMDPDVPVRQGTLARRVAQSLAERRFVMLLLAGFAVTALTLAAVGIYGVVSYTVAQRAREVGIRLALGADPGSVRGLVVRRAMTMVVGGLLAGIVGTLVVTRLMTSLLYGVTPADPVTLASVSVLLGFTGWLSCWWPARSGTRVDPVVTMKES